MDPNGVQKQIDEVIESSVDTPVVEPVETPVEEPPKSEVTTESPSEGAASEPAKIEESSEAVVEIPTEPEAPTIPQDKLQAIIDAQAAEIAKLKSPEPAQEPTKRITSAEVDAFLGNVDIDEVLDSKENFVKFMKDFASIIKEQARQETLMNIPQVVGTHIQQQTYMTNLANAFYEKHPELKRVKRYVMAVANEVHAANAGWTPEQVLEETAKKVKESLNIVKATPQSATTAVKPALPGSSGARQSTKAPDKLQSEIDDLLND